MKHLIFILLLETLATAGAIEIDQLESIKAKSLTEKLVVQFDGKLARKVYNKLKNTLVVKDKISKAEVKEVGSLSCRKKGRKYQCSLSYSLVPGDANLNSLESNKVFDALDTRLKKHVWHGGKSKVVRGYTSSDVDQFVCDQIPLEVKSDTNNIFNLYQCSLRSPKDRGGSLNGSISIGISIGG